MKWRGSKCTYGEVWELLRKASLVTLEQIPEGLKDVLNKNKILSWVYLVDTNWEEAHMAECSDGESSRLYGQRGNRKLITCILTDLCSDFGFLFWSRRHWKIFIRSLRRTKILKGSLDSMLKCPLGIRVEAGTLTVNNLGKSWCCFGPRM